MSFLTRIFMSIRPRIPSAMLPVPVADAPRKVEAIAFHTEGKMSTFGGPADEGVSSTEGLALWSANEIYHAPAGLFFKQQPQGTTGLARRLNPDAYYIACRWNYQELARRGITRAKLRQCRCVVRSIAEPKKFALCYPADWGPHPDTGRVADLSPGAARELGLRTDDRVTVTLVTPE